MGDWSKIISGGWVQLRYLSVNPPQLYPCVAMEKARESRTPSPTRVSPHLGNSEIKVEACVKMTNFLLFPFLDEKSSSGIQEGSPLPAY
jgi:hypothetical protein